MFLSDEESNYETPYSAAVMFGRPPPTIQQIKAMKAAGQTGVSGGGIYGELAQKIGQRSHTKLGNDFFFFFIILLA